MAQGTSEWTYQGSLTEAGVPATGNFDLRFKLFGVASEGTQLESQCFDNVPVTDGLFAVVLSLGTTTFNDQPRFIEIEVRRDTGLSCASAAGFTILGDRQRLRPTPFATYSLNAGFFGGVGPGSYARTDTPETFNDPVTITDTSSNLLTLRGSSSSGSILQLRSDSSARTFDLVSTGTFSAEGADRFAIRDATSGLSPFVIEGSTGFVGIGTSDPNRALDVRDGVIRVATDATGFGQVEMKVTPNEHGFLGILSSEGGFYVYAGESQVSGAVDVGGQVTVGNAAGIARGGFQVLANGDCRMFAQVKNFVVANPDDPSTEIYYACVEGPEAAMYTRGTGQLTNGRAIVTLPRHFTAMAAAAGITVQITPLSADCFGMAVVNKGVGGFEVRELMRGTSNAAFDWEVKAVRKGYEDYEVVRPAGLLNPRPVESGER